MYQRFRMRLMISKFLFPCLHFWEKKRFKFSLSAYVKHCLPYRDTQLSVRSYGLDMMKNKYRLPQMNLRDGIMLQTELDNQYDKPAVGRQSQLTEDGQVYLAVRLCPPRRQQVAKINVRCMAKFSKSRI